MAGPDLEFSRGDVIAGKYAIMEPLDESPLGKTYRARHEAEGHKVRLTVLNPALVARGWNKVVQAFRAAKEMTHPNLIEVGELGQHHTVFYYTTEDFEGQTLRDLLQEYKVEGRQFALEHAAQIARQIAAALTEVHDKGLVFRALRPEYILINARWTGPSQKNFVSNIKLFGASLWALVPSGVLAEEEFTRGEAQYLAPELRSFEPDATPRADIYSLGAVFYEMLTGIAIIGTYQLPSQVRPDLNKYVDQVIELALALSPDDRYAAPQAFIADLGRAFDDSAADEAPQQNAIGPIGIGIGVVLVVAVAAIIFAIVTQDQDAQLRYQDAQLKDQMRAQMPMPSLEDRAEVEGDHPPGMLYVPGGPFLKGRLNWDPNAGTGELEHTPTQVRPFLIDAFEFPNLRFAEPTRGVSWAEADQLCREVGKRLCTADEWEKACKGPGNYIYGYGDEYEGDLCGSDDSDRLYVSGSKEDCYTGWGAFDMAGNVREWTSTGASGGNRRLVKGGSPVKPEKGTRCAAAIDYPEEYREARLGFRCCRDVDAEPWTAGSN